MDWNDLVRLLLVVALVIIPALAVVVIATSRFALKPIVEAVLRLREGMESRAASTSGDGPRLALIEDELRELRGDVREIREAMSFLGQLRGESPAPPSPRLAAGEARPRPRLVSQQPVDPDAVENAGDYAQEYE